MVLNLYEGFGLIGCNNKLMLILNTLKPHGQTDWLITDLISLQDLLVRHYI